MSLTSERPNRWPCEASGMKTGDKIILDDGRSYEQAKTKLPDGPVLVIVVPVDKVRELKANNAYHGDLKTISTAMLDAGFPETQAKTEALHGMYKDLFNGGKTTATLDARTFATYHERVRAHAAQTYAVEFDVRPALSFLGVA